MRWWRVYLSAQRIQGQRRVRVGMVTFAASMTVCLSMWLLCVEREHSKRSNRRAECREVYDGRR